MGTSTKERRARQRIEIETGIQLLAPEANDRAVLRNISASGLLCITDRQLAEMTRVDLVIKLPPLPDERDTNHVVEAQGTVLRTDPIERGNSRRRFEVAICFSKIDAESSQVLQRFIRRRRC